MKRVLVVEDEISMRETLRCLMVRWRYDVTLSNSFQEAQHSFLNGPEFDLVVSDFLLPDGDGRQFFQWLRQERFTQVPFLMVSGNFSPQKEDAFEFLAKPFNIARLREAMDRMTGLAHSSMAAG
jgi:DNA-binding NtrC family response regulator